MSGYMITHNRTQILIVRILHIMDKSLIRYFLHSIVSTILSRIDEQAGLWAKAVTVFVIFIFDTEIRPYGSIDEIGMGFDI